jgi:hypothetical protein
MLRSSSCAWRSHAAKERSIGRLSRLSPVFDGEPSLFFSLFLIHIKDCSVRLCRMSGII